MSKVVLSGYYGYSNAGDETILYAIIRALQQIDPDLEITVLSRNPEKTSKQFQVKAVNRWGIGEIIRTLLKSDLLISGGGSLLQDATSPTSPLYYLGITFLARILGKPVFVYAQGIGPLKRTWIRKLTAWSYNRVSHLTVRDQASQEDLVAMGVKKTITVTADPVLGLAKDEIDLKSGQHILERNGIEISPEQKLIGVFIRSWQDDDFLIPLAKACDQLVEEGWKLIFVPMQFPSDIKSAKEVIKLMEQEAHYLKESYAPEEILSLTGNFQLILGMRLHALINAALMEVPMVGISYDPKVDRFLEQMSQTSLVSAFQLNSSTLVEMVKCVEQHGRELVESRREKVQFLHHKAWQTARMVEEFLSNDSKNS